jgi:hypothetical protein
MFNGANLFATIIYFCDYVLRIETTCAALVPNRPIISGATPSMSSRLSVMTSGSKKPALAKKRRFLGIILFIKSASGWGTVGETVRR